MLFSISGTVEFVYLDKVIIECNGIGYEIICSENTLKNINPEGTAKLFTHLHLSENLIALYGFSTEEERDMFRRLICVSRIGPKLAISVLSKLTPSDIVSAVLTDNANAFDSVSGLGKKTAQHLIFEMKDKIKDLDADGFNVQNNNYMSEAVAALIALGYDGLSASKAVNSVSNAGSVEEMIKLALKNMLK